jgi:hypothetical protein
LLKQLARAHLRGSEIILPDGEPFDDRCFDDCFESGDGEEVVALIMQAHRTDPDLRHAFEQGYSRNFVAADRWARILEDREARQPGILPLD